MKNLLSLVICCVVYQLSAQEEDTTSSTIEEVVISSSKTQEKKRLIPQEIVTISKDELNRSFSQSTADVLQQANAAYIQKSQFGGGSITIRGFEASRNLIVVDGIRMNNLIYRAGHLQNVITVDNQSLERIEVLSGPSSTMYGSDALGGVVHLMTKSLLYKESLPDMYKARFRTRYSSVNNEKNFHLDVFNGGEKFASYFGFGFVDFGDVSVGKNKNPFYHSEYGLQNDYQTRINGVDTMLQNTNPYQIKNTSYQQYDGIWKLAYRPNKNVEHQLNLQFSTSTNINRTDRLSERASNGIAKLAEWYYGPQQRLIMAYDFKWKLNKKWSDDIQITANFQDIQESRVTRSFGSANRTHRIEDVNVYGFLVYSTKKIGKNSFRFGLDAQFNTLSSNAFAHNIVSGVESSATTRYPNGDNRLFNAALFFSHARKISEKWYLNDGLRVSYNALSANMADTSFYPFPYVNFEQNNPAYSGNVGLVYLPNKKWKISSQLATGFRNPNIDDLSKIFDSKQGNVVLSNPNLMPEQTISGDVGLTYFLNDNLYLELAGYYTYFMDAIALDDATYLGEDSIVYDGVLSKIQMNTNKNSAYVTGFTSRLKGKINEHFSTNLSCTYTRGRFFTAPTFSPLDHIPPFIAAGSIIASIGNVEANVFINYQAWKKIENYRLDAEDNEEYAPSEGMPAWITANARLSYQIKKIANITVGVDNIFDTQYRTFASGINGNGRNIFVAVKFTLN